MSTDKSPIRLIAFASLIGTTIEWYDFFLYNTAAALVFNKLFFPTFDPLAGTMAAFGTYAVGFAARPIGGIVIGHYGDKLGRKSMLVLTLVIMGDRDLPDWRAADLREHRPVGGRPADPAASRAGIRRRRRVGRRGADGRRACARRPARFLRQLAANRRAGRAADVDDRVFPVFAGCRRRSSWPGAGACRSCSASCWWASAS